MDKKLMNETIKMLKMVIINLEELAGQVDNRRDKINLDNYISNAYGIYHQLDNKYSKK